MHLPRPILYVKKENDDDAFQKYPDLQTWISERLCGSLLFHPRSLQMWLVVTEGCSPSSLLGEKIWNPVSVRTETV